MMIARRPRLPLARHWARALAWLLLGGGVLLLADVGLTLVWQEPVSAIYAHLRQDSLGHDLRRLERAPPDRSAALGLRRLSDQRARIAYLAQALQRHAHRGAAVGRIIIPSIGASFVMVKGTDESELQSGPGLYPQTGFPSVQGTTAIAGHRTTYLAPFRHIDALRRGNRIVLLMPYGRFTYRVSGSRVVAPSDVSVIDPVGYPQLVLSACTPLFSASHRLIVFARLQSIAPLGAVRRGVGAGAPLSFPWPPARARAGMGGQGRSGGPGHPRGARPLPQMLKSLERLPLSLVA